MLHQRPWSASTGRTNVVLSILKRLPDALTADLPTALWFTRGRQLGVSGSYAFRQSRERQTRVVFGGGAFFKLLVTGLKTRVAAQALLKVAAEARPHLSGTPAPRAPAPEQQGQQ